MVGKAQQQERVMDCQQSGSKVITTGAKIMSPFYSVFLSRPSQCNNVPPFREALPTQLLLVRNPLTDKPRVLSPK